MHLRAFVWKQENVPCRRIVSYFAGFCFSAKWMGDSLFHVMFVLINSVKYAVWIRENVLRETR